MDTEYKIISLCESEGIDLAFAIDCCEIVNSPSRHLYVRGWFFAPSGRPATLLHEDKEIKIQRHERQDVFIAFNKQYEQALLSGFECRINIDKKAETLTAILSVADVNRVSFEFDLKQIDLRCKAMRYDRLRRAYSRECWEEWFYGAQVMGFRWFVRQALNASSASPKEIPEDQSRYEKWIINNEYYSSPDVRGSISKMQHKPLISILIPVYNVEPRWLIRCVRSIQKQSYRHWELCLADDCSTNTDVRPTLKRLAAADRRIKVVYRTENGHISKATNSALEIANGEYIALVDNDDELHKHALFEIVSCINDHPDADLIYSDEDKIDVNHQRRDPHFKPNWSPDTILSSNYISHLGVYRKSIVDEIGGFRAGYEGSQDYDLVLRFTEKTDHIYHVPKVLYHWRTIEGSTALGGDQKNYPYLAGVRALEDAIARRQWIAKVEDIPGIPYYNVVFKPSQDNLVSIIIPTRDRADLLKTCIDSITAKTTYKNYEIIVVDNGSVEKETQDLFADYEQANQRFRLLRLDIPFNFSILNNEAAKIAKGDVLLFLNNDVEIIHGDWLERMLGRAIREKTGAVGAKLYYPDDRIQHAGLVLGLGGVAGHIFSLNDKRNPGYFARSMINYNYSAVTGACLMVRKSIFDQVGGFEEKLSVAFNDIDLCIKLLNKGYFNLFCADVQLYHHESVSRGKEDSPEKLDRLQIESQYMEEKWGELLREDPFYSPHLSLADFDARIKIYEL